MKKLNYLFISLLILISVIFYSCGGTEQTGNDNIGNQANDSVYVFDQPVLDNNIAEQPKVTPSSREAKYYVVQIGAFTTKDKADKFTEEAKKLLKNKIEISYSSDINLYVVQLTPPYNKKEVAEKVRNNLWKIEKFKDAWILIFYFFCVDNWKLLFIITKLEIVANL
jgi:predicted metal-dependent TIM-barrel fold hydrolase